MNTQTKAQGTGGPLPNLKSFEKIYGGGEIRAINQDSAGNLYLAMNGNVAVLKVDQNGNKIWARDYLGLMPGGIMSMKLLPDGGKLLAGAVQFYYPNRQMDAFLIKLDANGHFIVGKLIDDPGVGNSYTYGWSIEADDSAYYFCAETDGFSGVAGGLLVVKTDFNLNLQLACLFSDWIFVNGINKIHDGTFIISGSCSNPITSKVNLFLMKIDKYLNQEWFKVYGNNTGYQSACSLIETTDSNVLVVGAINNNSVEGESDAYILKVNPQNGDTIFTRSIGTSGSQAAFSVVEKNSEYLISGGSVDLALGESKTFLFSMKEGGSLLKSSHLGAISSGSVSCGYSIISKEDDLFIGGVNQSSVFLIKTKNDTVSECNKQNSNIFYQNYQTSVYGRAVTRTIVNPVITNLANTESSLTITTTTNCFSYFVDTSTVLVEENSTKEGIKIFPNPAKDYVVIEGCINQNIILYDFLGRTIFSKIINTDSEKINLNDFVPGMYFCKIGTDNNLKKFVVSK